jgi:putative DNA primase/helicase
MTQLLDFNDAAEPTRRSIDADSIRDGLLDRLESMLRTYLPAGVFRAGKFQIGNVRGEPGDSLSVSLDGPKRGQWYDFATSQGGDHIELFAQAQGLSARSDFREVLERAAQWLGTAQPGVSESVSVRATPQRARPRSADAPDLGPPTAKWDYLAADGTLLACVYRYEPEAGRKEFRPWNVRTGRFEGLDPRPLYNQPALARAETVILVEGEKCAQALIDLGICATTAMHGARAPVDKTDWSPLAGKDVLIWPDKDSPGWDYAIAASGAIVAVGGRSCAILLPPEDRAEGWDCADAVAEQVDVNAFIRDAERMVIHGPDLASAANDAEQTPTAVWGTEDGMALHFTARYSADWRYVAAWGQWLVWTGMRWVPEATLRATDLIRGVCRQHALEADSPRLAAKLAASGTVAGVERLARSDRLHAANADEWDADPWLLNTLGGVVDLRNGSVRPHDRADRMTKLAAARLGDAGACPTWRKFLVECTGGDSELIDYLQRICGYCLTGQTREHALFFLYGTGANGKSVFVNTLSALLAEYATHAPMEMFMETRSDRHPTDLAGLRGARLVSSVETEQGRRWNESKIKTLTGGDKVSARFMRQDFFEYIPQFKLLIAGNHKPSIRNLDEAMRRRLQLIPFTITVPPDRRDKQLEDKIWRERDAVLAWMVEGCLAWQRKGLRPPRCVVEATDDYFESEDALGRWIEERCFVERVARATAADLFEDWRGWAEKAGEFAGSIKRFSELLTNRRFERAKFSGGTRGFVGLSLRPKPVGPLPYRDD